jgi:hypothetical protein
MTSFIVLIWISIIVLISHLTCTKSKIEVVAYLVAQWVSIWAVLYEAGSMKQQNILKRTFRILAFITFILYMLVISYSYLSVNFGLYPLENLF